MYLKTGQLILVLAVCSMLVSCKNEVEIIKPSPTEEQRVRQIGKKTAGLLLKSLQNELKTTITDDGMIAALSVCNFKALQLTDSLKHSIEEVFELKRSSLRYRNPINTPDAIEREALISFQKYLIKSESLPEDMIVKVIDISGQHFRYFKPLLIKPLCLNCHGQSGNIAPEVSNHLKKLYPEDHATGYSIDQLRGLISISVR